MTVQRPHEQFEVLLVKAVDGALSDQERRELEDHLATCSECAEELSDFRLIKETTDAMTSRILQDAALEPLRPTGVARAWLSLSFALLLVGALLLLGFFGYTVAVASDVPWIVKAGLAAGSAGLLGLLGYTLRARLRGRDPYEEIDL